MALIHLTFSRALIDVQKNKIDIQAENINQVLMFLSRKFGGRFSEKFYDENRRPKRIINVYVNGIEIRSLDGLSTKLKNDDEIVMIPAVTGGSILGMHI